MTEHWFQPLRPRCARLRCGLRWGPRSGPRRRTGPVRDAGETMVELLVAMLVLSFVMIAFTAAINVMISTTRRVQAIATAATQARAAVDQFSRVVPFAAAVNTPTKVGNDWYLETWTDAMNGALATCTQWRLTAATDRLEVRTWPAGSTTQPALSTLVARSIVNDPVTQPPFTVLTDPAYVPSVGLDLWVARQDTTAAETQSHFTLRNALTTGATGVDVVCKDGPSSGVPRP